MKQNRAIEPELNLDQVQNQVQVQPLNLQPKLSQSVLVWNTATIFFDGGSKGNPGPSYGSFEIETMKKGFYTCHRHKWHTSNPFTCNEAEYLTLWLALGDLKHKFPFVTVLHVFSDSSLLVNQVNGTWKAKHPKMKVLRDKILKLLSGMRWQLFWNSRTVNVSKFGH